MCHNCIMENGDSLNLEDGGPIPSGKICREKQGRESLKQDNAIPMISPVPTLSSSDSSISSFSDYSVDLNSNERDNQAGPLGRNHEDLNCRLDLKPHQSSNGCRETTVIKQSNHDQEVQTNNPGDCKRSVNEAENDPPLYGEMGPEIWEPPGPEDPDDDMDGSVAYSDDEECGDGTVWGKSSSLSHSGDEGSGSYRLKEEKKRAMDEVRNGKFKAIVYQLIKSIGVAPYGEDAESWLDIVTSLSWEAASFLKPDAVYGKAMDASRDVKVKCIATGSRSESQFIKGLVFKKHAAHKHMPTKYSNPRLLLNKGMLGHSSSGLSSFEAMDKEKDYMMKSVTEMIELCNPNVVLVEKTVSRDIQESILKKGMTLVLDMKLHRLERIARCTGSPILSPQDLMNKKLKQCDSFHIEKFVEEHAECSEGGKKPSKTLMFIEGCPTRLGCTILLKGAHSDKLKRIKCAVQCAVVLASHLILENSFLVDQRGMFSTIQTGVASILPPDQMFSEVGSGKPSVNPVEESTAGNSSSTIDLSSNGIQEGGFDNLKLEIEGNSTIFNEPYNLAILSGWTSLSSSLKKVTDEQIPLENSYFSFHGSNTDPETVKDVSVSSTPEATDHSDLETKGSSDDEYSVIAEQYKQLPEVSDKPPEMEKDLIQNKDDTNAALDSQSILVLMSVQNASKGTICKQSHFSHIMFYKNFDIPLGTFLQENLLNQRNKCTTCDELPEAHFYYYAHHNKQLTIHVKQFPRGKSLPGKTEGKIWMWSRCGKCKSEKGIANSTKRVLLSSAARCLSFGKFLELNFSIHSSSSKSSSCGHSLSRDFLCFFGLGNMAAMFIYSTVATYTVSMPPQKLKFKNSIRPERLMKDTHIDVKRKGDLLFSEVANCLKMIRSQLESSTTNLQDSLKEVSLVEEILDKERSEFEVYLQNVISEDADPEQAIYKPLILNRLRWELLLESCIWDQRLHLLLTSERVYSKKKSGVDRGSERRESAENGYVASEESLNLNVESYNYQERNEFLVKEIPVEGCDKECGGSDLLSASSVAEVIEPPIEDGPSPKGFSDEESVQIKPKFSIHNHSDDDSNHMESFHSHNHSQLQGTVMNSIDYEHTNSMTNGDISKDDTLGHPLGSSSVNSIEWFWSPFAEIRHIDLDLLQRSYLPKIESISSYTRKNLPSAYQLIIDEARRLHIPLGTDSYIVSDYEGELSSIIACMLALLKDQPIQTEVFDSYSKSDGRGSSKSSESLHSLNRIPSNSSSESDSVHSSTSNITEESRFSSFDGLIFLDSLVPESFMPTEHEGIAKSLGKGKYLVNCPYFNRFRDLRSRCCQSELHYIASLSRCRNWDAKGGKSKSFFAKTLDDRFIIKEIKKTEYDSFMKFALEYFNYMNQSYEVGNQTCLAKVLGIYQVTVRHEKSGKETRHDLMVMENLTFGRKITRQYDLKGALYARYNTATAGSDNVLLDQNFVNDMNSSPLYVSNNAKRLLQRAVWNDTTFLNSINVMDYSLLVGVDTEKRELVCGIIDYLRQYTWDKQLETWVKSSLVPKNVLPTVISPIEYKRRFRKFMSTHFLSVPDHWCSENSSDPCELCGDNDSSHHAKSQRSEQNGFPSS